MRLRYIPVAIYEVGLCHYGHRESYKTVEVAADDKMKALRLAHPLLKPNTVEHIDIVGVRPNPEHIEFNKKLKEHYASSDVQRGTESPC